MLDKARFALLEKEKKQWLKGLTMQKAIRLEERLLSSALIWEWRKNFSPDDPISLKNILTKRKTGF